MKKTTLSIFICSVLHTIITPASSSEDKMVFVPFVVAQLQSGNVSVHTFRTSTLYDGIRTEVLQKYLENTHEVPVGLVEFCDFGELSSFVKDILIDKKIVTFGEGAQPNFPHIPESFIPGTSHVIRGMYFESIGNLNEAESCFMQGTEELNYDAMSQLAALLAKRDLNPEAIAFYKLAIKRGNQLRANMGIEWNNLACLYEKIHDNDNAVKAYQKALNQSPPLIVAHCNLGRLHAKVGEYEKAKACFIKGKEARDDRALNLLGTLALKRLQFDEAQASFLEATGSSIPVRPLPDHEKAVAYNNLGMVYWAKRDFDNAARAFVAAIDMNDDEVSENAKGNLAVLARQKDTFSSENVIEMRIKRQMESIVV